MHSQFHDKQIWKIMYTQRIQGSMLKLILNNANTSTRVSPDGCANGRGTKLYEQLCQHQCQNESKHSAQILIDKVMPKG